MRYLRAGLPTVFFATTIALVAAPYSAHAQTPIQFPNYGIAFSTPDGYRVSEPQGAGTDAVPCFYLATGPFINKSATNININAQEISIPTLPPDFGSEITGQLTKEVESTTEDFKIVSKKAITLAGTPAYEISSTFRMKGSPINIRNRQVFAIKNGRFFTITFSAEAGAFAKDSPTFDAFLKSVRWISVAKADK